MGVERSRRRPAKETPARLVVDLPEGVHRQLKARAAREGVTIREYVLALLKQAGLGD